MTPEEENAVLRAENAALREQVRALLAEGIAQNPQPLHPAPAAGEGSKRRRGRRKQSPVHNLLDRLWACEHEVLAFLDDFAIPFDNNQAERGLRAIKVQQNISGTFRSEPGADAFCRLRSVLSTRRMQGRSGLAALEAAFIGRPLSPQPPS
jgi:transposase